jgi:hypothetical protein
MFMRRSFALLGLIALLAIPAVALADATLNPGNVGEGCSGDGEYHFVARKGSSSDRLSATFTGGSVSNEAPDAVNRGVAHFWVDGSGTVISASVVGTADKLVLSQSICDEKKDDDGGKK